MRRKETIHTLNRKYDHLRARVTRVYDTIREVGPYALFSELNAACTGSALDTKFGLGQQVATLTVLVRLAERIIETHNKEV